MKINDFIICIKENSKAMKILYCFNKTKKRNQNEQNIKKSTGIFENKKTESLCTIIKVFQKFFNALQKQIKYSYTKGNSLSQKKKNKQ